VKRLPPWLTYTVLRLLAIAVPLAILLLIVPFEFWPVSVVAAVIIGLCLSYLLLGKQRDAVARELQQRRGKRQRTSDDDFEDAEVDREATTPSEGEGRAEADAVEQSDDSGQL